MAVNLQGYSTPVNQFEGLYHLAGVNRQEQAAAAATAQREQARRAASGAMLTDYLDPKQFMTGTVYDPYISDRVGQIMQKGLEFANVQGMDNNTLLGAISGEVGKLSNEAVTIRTIDQQRKEAEKLLGSTKGINLQRFNNRFKEYVYFETDENGEKKLKDISQIRPDQDWADEVVRTQPIYDNAAFDEFVAKSGKMTREEGVTVKDARGNLRKTNVEMQSPTFMQPEFDDKGVFSGTFVPKYKIAVDEQKPIIAQFLTEEGRTVPAAIRILDDEAWTALPNAAKAYAVQEAKRFAQAKGIAVSDPRVETFAKALAYDEVKSSGKQYSTFKENKAAQAAPAPKTTVNINTGKGTESVVNDLYSRMDKELTRLTEYGEKAPPLNLIADADGISVVLDMVNKGRGEGARFVPEQLTVRRGGNGEMLVYNKDKFLVTLPKVGVNLKVQPDVKAKRTVVSQQGNTKAAAPTAKPKKEMTLAEKMREAAQKK
jgi:hypothetical protein